MPRARIRARIRIWKKSNPRAKSRRGGYLGAGNGTGVVKVQAKNGW